MNESCQLVEEIYQQMKFPVLEKLLRLCWRVIPITLERLEIYAR
ncbi:hypothetical protein SH139x_004132 [Planctomycetaceae bacterium SH139]